MERKARRQKALLELLRNQQFGNQSDVVHAMIDEGFSVTQSSVSRDFHELGVVKLAGRYLSANGTLRTDEGDEVALLVDNVEPVGPHLVVIKTKIGAAGVVGAALDSRTIEGVAGTVAGDDTVFVATRNRGCQSRVIHALRSLS